MSVVAQSLSRGGRQYLLLRNDYDISEVYRSLGGSGRRQLYQCRVAEGGSGSLVAKLVCILQQPDARRPEGSSRPARTPNILARGGEPGAIAEVSTLRNDFTKNWERAEHVI